MAAAGGTMKSKEDVLRKFLLGGSSAAAAYKKKPVTMAVPAAVAASVVQQPQSVQTISQTATDSKTAPNSAPTTAADTTGSGGGTGGTGGSGSASGSGSDGGRSETDYLSLPFQFDANAVLPKPRSAYAVSTVPAALYYVPDWMTESEEREILSLTERAPPERWTYLRRRSLQMWGGSPSPDGMKCEPLPNWLCAVRDRLVRQRLFPAADAGGGVPNHVLINRYEVGQGISPHKDGPLYTPFVAIVSCGGSVVLSFYQSLADHQNRKPCAELFCATRSVLLFERSFYHDFWHSIDEIETDIITDKVVNRSVHGLSVGDSVPRSAARVSLTIRIAPTTPISGAATTTATATATATASVSVAPAPNASADTKTAETAIAVTATAAPSNGGGSGSAPPAVLKS